MAYYDNLAQDGFAITPSDTAALPTTAYGVYVGVTGDVNLVLSSGAELLFKNAQAGSTIPYAVKAVKAASTTATNLIGAKMI